MPFLSKPEVMCCVCDLDVSPKMSAMELRWPADASATERHWHLPQGVSIHSPAPTRFGIAIERLGDDAFKLQLVWNHTFCVWSSLRRVEIMTSSLSLILKALGTDLWDLLQQPIPNSIAA